jgi:hypothetical protein
VSRIRLARSIILSLLLLMACQAVAAERTVYVPTTHVLRPIASPSGGDGQGWSLRLGSHFMVFNSASEPRSVTLVAWYDQDGVKHEGFPAGGASVLAPGKAGLMNAGFCDPPETGCVSIAELRVEDGVAVRNTLERSYLVGAGCFPVPTTGGLSQGRVPLPVFEGLHPAGTVAACGDVMPFNAGGAQICSNVKDQKYVRRLNLTLFNGGEEPATFVVKGYRSVFDPPTVVFTATYGLGPETVTQINSFYAPPIPVDCYPHEENLWFTITADQPFLAYISTIFDDPGPGVNPYQIYPALTK